MIFFGLMLLGSTIVEGKEVETTVGQWTGVSGKIKFSVVNTNGRKIAHVWVTDEHIISTNMFFMKSHDLIKLRSLIDETLTEMKQ